MGDLQNRVDHALSKLKKGDLLVLEWIDVRSESLEWQDVEKADTAQIRSCGFLHGYDGKNLILARDLDPVEGQDATPTVIPMGAIVNVVISCLRVPLDQAEEVWDVGVTEAPPEPPT